MFRWNINIDSNIRLKYKDMPAKPCDNGKWKWGNNGDCVFDTRQDAQKAGIAILIDKQNKLRDTLNNEWKRYGSKD